MKLPDRFPPNDAREWLNRARSNLAISRSKLPGVYFEDLCFEAQQAAEKAIKAVMIIRAINFPYVHDLTLLLSLLGEAGESIPEAVWRAEELTTYARNTRYPSAESPVTSQEHRAAIEIAESVVRWAEERL